MNVDCIASISAQTSPVSICLWEERFCCWVFWTMTRSARTTLLEKFPYTCHLLLQWKCQPLWTQSLLSCYRLNAPPLKLRGLTKYGIYSNIISFLIEFLTDVPVIHKYRLDTWYILKNKIWWNLIPTQFYLD